MGRSVKIQESTLNVGPGSATSLIACDPLDYSKYHALTLRASLTTTDTDALDTCSLRLEVTADPVTPVWDTRVRLEDFTGTMSASATAPETLRGACRNSDYVSSVDSEYEETGSASATELTAGAVRHGPFYPPVHSGTVNLPTARIKCVLTDADNDASFIGTVQLWGVTSP